MNTNDILLIINLVLTVIVPVMANIIQSIISNCKIKRSDCCGAHIENYDPRLKKNKSDDNLKNTA